jgi:hypothetical protein
MSDPRKMADCSGGVKLGLLAPDRNVYPTQGYILHVKVAGKEVCYDHVALRRSLRESHLFYNIPD